MKKTLFLLMLCLVQISPENSTAQTCGTRNLAPDIAYFLNMIGYKDLTLEQLRQIPIEQLKYAGPPAMPYPVADVQRIKITVDSIPVLVFNATHGKHLPIIINYHGGGFISPLLPCLEQPLWLESKNLEAVVFAVDYRVAPEHRFPAALNDSYSAFKWISEHGNEFGGDIDKIVLEGTSAGANLVAVMAQKAKKEGISRKIKLQVMNGLPVDLSPKNMETSISYQENAVGYFQTKAACYFALEQYAPGQYDNPEVSPILTKDLKGLPPAVIITAEFDPLRDDGALYAAQLKSAGVPVWEHCFPGQIHCLIGLLPGAKELQTFEDLVKEAMKISFVKK
ncbi:alpha/beta hydrolase [Flavobacterium silvisoli]|uniref:Alpha/beta hydrolase n=1 Tax=Flavobacterium silvisoli TaxID=2529433 RepID=A0A4Q9Z216_9FLAO|nr:alpha/beta hydrolase [Flavobacterium silvisoli]TBX70132.1 alpha/beta hydrolase [Flavobacterium silvisoli]